MDVMHVTGATDDRGGGGGRGWRSARRGYRGNATRGFTVIELLVTAVLSVVGAAVVVVLLTGVTRARTCGGRPMRDSTQVRGILQGMIIFAGNNKDQYPLPSALDARNATVSELGTAKDTTANIFSILIYQGSVPVDMCVSPAEVNRAIVVDEKYEFEIPKKAVDPANALWDPGFTADFTGAGTGHLSYGHLMPTGNKPWSNTFSATEAVIGNRGPEIAMVTKGRWPSVKPRLVNPNSNTLLIHGSRNSWEGNIGYNDNHVNFETTMLGSGGGDDPKTYYTDTSGLKWQDVFFYDEPDDATGKNAYLGIFTKAGTTAAEFKAIWD